MTKLKIDMKNGYLEVEGEEAFVSGIYADYKDILSLVIARQPEVDKPTAGISPAQKLPTPLEVKKAVSSKPSGTKSLESYKIVGDLNLNPADKVSFKQFVSDKAPETSQEINAVAVYYLQKILGIEGVTVEHIYTCYKQAEKKMPTGLKQSLKDTVRHKGWINCSDMSKIHLNISGENLVEHELPRQKGSDKQ